MTRSSFGSSSVDHERPGRIAVDVRNVAAPAPLELVGQHVDETLRPAAERRSRRRECRSARRRPRRPSHGRFRATSRNESLPGRPPSGPNSSPATSTKPGADPAPAQLVEEPARGVGLVGEPDLDVLRVARHARVRQARSSAALRRELDRLAKTAEARLAAVVPRPPPSSSAIRAFGGSAHSGLGDQVDLPSVQALRHDRGAQPATASASTVASAAASSARSSAGVASRLYDERPRRSSAARKTSEPRLTQRCRRPGPGGRAPSCPSTLPTWVPVTTARSRPRCAQLPRRGRGAGGASACRSGTAVPSQSKTIASKRRSSSSGGTNRRLLRRFSVTLIRRDALRRIDASCRARGQQATADPVTCWRSALATS